MHLNKDLREFIELLNTNKVEYLIVGAFAVAWHGYTRFTANINFFIRSTSTNADTVVATLGDFGFAGLKVTRDDLNRPGQVIQLGAKPNRIGLITSIAGVEFEQAWTGREVGTIDGIPVPFIGIKELIVNKESIGRFKDLGDAEELRKRHPKGK